MAKDKTKKRKMPRALKIVLGTVLSLVLVTVGVVGGYLIYVTAYHSRTGDRVLRVEGSAELSLAAGVEYTAVTYNIGFGAYSPDFDFFMDGGKGSVAKSKAEVLKNTTGAAETVKTLQADFVLLQEVDTKATRSKQVNQNLLIRDALQASAAYQSIFAENFDSPYLMYPIFSPIGKSKSGIATHSKYPITDAVRKELPVSKTWPSYLFDLDRCYSVSRVPAGEKELVLVNLHLTAFESSGGKVRAAQLRALEELLTAEQDNYVVIGGDFNHDLITTYGGDPADYFTYTKPDEDWVAYLPETFKTFLSQAGYGFHYPTNQPTCRSSAYPYQENVSRVWVIDGFIVSGNIEVTGIETADQSNCPQYENFMYSDHNPVKLTFKLTA